MQKLTIKAPATTQAFYSKGERAMLYRAIKAIERKYGGYILEASLACNVKSAVITSVILLQSNGNEKLVTGSAMDTQKHYGLMQLTPETAVAVIHLESKMVNMNGKLESRLSPTEYNLLVKYIGKDRTDCYTKTMQNLGPDEYNKCRPLKSTDMLLPGFSILVGTMLLGRLLDETREGEELRLDRAYLKYNMDPFYQIKAKKFAPIDEVLKEAKKIGNKQYEGILKLVGANGLLDVIA